MAALKILGSILDANEREVRQHLHTAKAIAELEPELEALDDTALRAHSDELRERARAGEELEELKRVG